MAATQASLPFTLLLGVLVALTALGMDMFLPAVPVLAGALGMEPGAAQHSVTGYLLGLAIGQLAWGPVSDRFGRKPVLLAGLALFLASSVGGALAESLRSVVLLRFAQGVGISSGPVLARSIVRDLYAREHAAHLLARMMAVFGIVPVAAPLIGAQALAWKGWPAVFWVFAAIAVALLAAVALGLRETAPAERPSVAPGRIATSFASLFGDARFRAALATMLFAQMGIIAFVSSSALAMVQALRLTPTAFSVLFAAVMLGQIVGGYAGSRLVAHLGSARMVRLGTMLVLVAGATLALLAYSGAAHWSAVVLPMVVYLFGCALVIPNTTAAALSPFPLMAGSASSLLGTLPFGLGALVSAALAAAFDGTVRPMAYAIALFGACSFAAERLLFRKVVHP
ncbi:MAG TPA: multidrug effflux MFS transporter [Burkholderiales bacterium]|nr:multidrug effflux MFS transporter [Burkholderiales bacterium]